MVTPLQHRVFLFIEQFITEKGYSPSLVEIAKGINISPRSISLISRSIRALREAGKLKSDKGYRSVAVADADLVLPILSPQICNQKQILDLAVFKDKNHFLAQITDEAIADMGILAGDFALCKKTQYVNEGETVVVFIIDQNIMTIRRLSYHVPNRITLSSTDPSIKPKAYLPQRLTIQGIFKGLLRLRSDID